MKFAIRPGYLPGVGMNENADPRFTAIHNDTIRLYADGRLRRVDESGEERVQLRSRFDKGCLGAEDLATFEAWEAEKALLDQAYGYK